MANSNTKSKRHTPKLTKIQGGKTDPEEVTEEEPELEVGDFSPRVNQYLLKPDGVFNHDVRELALKGLECENIMGSLQGILSELQELPMPALTHNKIGQLAQLANALGEEAVIRIAQCISAEGEL